MNIDLIAKFVNLCENNSFSYCDPYLKEKLHRQGINVLRQFSSVLGLESSQRDIRSNKGGIAVSGEITLHAEDFYMQINADRGDIMIRGCKGRKDFCGKTNNFLPISALTNPEAVLECINRVREEN